MERLDGMIARDLVEPRPAAASCIQCPKKFIDDHLHEPLSVRELARQVGLCGEHCGRQLKKSCGVTVANTLSVPASNAPRNYYAMTWAAVSE